MKRALVLLLPLMMIGAGCPGQKRQPLGPAALKKFASATEFKQYVAEQYRGYNTGWDAPFGCSGMPAPNFMGGMPSSAENSPGGARSDDFSGTNLQEAGVDESDVVKTDGTHLYVVARQKLDIVKATPPGEMAVLGHLDLDLPGHELYLQENRAIVLAQPSYYYYGWGWTAPAGSGSVDSGTEEPWLQDQPTFDAYVVDVATPTAPALLKKYSFQGTLVTSRMIGSKLYMVSITYPNISPLMGAGGVETADVADVLPKYRTVAGKQESIEPLVGWEDVYHPVNPQGYSLINVTTVDTANLEAAPVSTSIVANYGVIYASTQALYVTSTNYDWYGYERDQTEVHKFDLTGDSAAYAASGMIPGWLLNQFSMGEKDGFLRVATTEGHSWSGMFSTGLVGAIFSDVVPASENHLVMLEQVDDKLEIVGRIDGIAPGEELYAARFVGDRGFLVTFQKIDPLFTVDLSNPREPKILGELKVPGYSEYIHMLDENHLLTIGKDAQQEDGFAWYLGLKLSIFDVTDMANPQELHTATLGVQGTDSEALRNHKAFTYHNGLLAFPVDLYEGNAVPPSFGNYTFGGLMVYSVSAEAGFAELGRIATVRQDGPYYWGLNQWTRGVFIGEHVYAICDHNIKAAAVADMANLLKTVDLP